MPLLPHLRSLRNSPTSARDLSQILSPIRLGLWFTFFNLAAALAFTTLFSFITYANNYPNSADSLLVTSVELGQIFASVLFYTIAIFLTVFIPIRIFGFLIGPRTLRYFDQIVISGISPSRYMAGKVILQNLFFVIVLAASVPYLALCFSLGGVSLPFVIGSILTLWLYANLLCLVTLAASVITFEFVAVPCVILFFGLALWIGIFPIPPHPFNFTPASVFAAPSYESLISGDSYFAREFGPIFSLVAPFGLVSSHILFYVVTIAFLAACLFLFLSIGPLNAIGGPLTNFGAVVMPGDAKKKRVFRSHHNLRRRGEVAFFYENRPARLRALDLPLRWGLKEIVFLALLVPFVIYLHLFAPLFWGFDFYAILLTTGIIALLVNAFIFTRDRSTANVRYPKCSAATADTILFSCNVAVVLLLVFALPMILATYFTPISFARSSQSALTFSDNFISIGLIVSLCAFTFFSIAGWLTTLFWSHFRAFATAFLLYGAIVLIPMFIYAGVASSSRSYSTGELVAGHIASISPIIPIGVLLDERILRFLITPSFWPFLITHVTVALFFFFLARRRRKKFPAVSPS